MLSVALVALAIAAAAATIEVPRRIFKCCSTQAPGRDKGTRRRMLSKDSADPSYMAVCTGPAGMDADLKKKPTDTGRSAFVVRVDQKQKDPAGVLVGVSQREALAHVEDNEVDILVGASLQPFHYHTWQLKHVLVLPGCVCLCLKNGRTVALHTHEPSLLAGTIHAHMATLKVLTHAQPPEGKQSAGSH